MAVRSGYRKRPSRVLAALPSVLVVFLMLPVPPAAAAGTINAENYVTLFFNERTLLSADNATIVGTNPASNGNDRDYGFRFPVNGIAAEAGFDFESLHGYKWRNQTHNNQGAWNPPSGGYTFNGTTSLFGLRLALDSISPFRNPSSTNATQSVNVGAYAYDVAAGDFDSDGRDDLAVIVTGAVQVRLNRGENFLNSTSFSITGTPMGVKATDLNLDGRRDFVAVTSSGSATYLYPFLQMPGGTVRQEGPITATSDCCSTPNGFDVGDLSGDGYPDVAVLYSNRTAYWLNQFSGKNLDTWGANDYSVKLQSAQYTNRPNYIAAAPAACPALVAVGNANNNIYVYWQSNMTLVATLSNHTNAINGLAWSPDCAWLASASTDKNIDLWRTSNWTIASSIVSHTSTAYAVAFSPNSALLASGAADGYLKIWNLSALPSTPTLDYNVSDANGTIYTLAFAPNGSYIAAGTGNKVVRVRTTLDYSLVTNLTGHTFAIRTLAYSPDGLTLVSGSDDDKMFIWDAPNFTKTLERTMFTADVYRVAFAVDGTRLIAGSLDGHARVFQASDWTMLDDVVEGSLFVYGADFERSGANIFTGGTSNYFRLWDKSLLVSLQRTQTRQAFTILGVAYDTDGKLASAAEDGSVVVSWPSNGTVVARLEAHVGTANAVAWLPGQAGLVTAGSDGTVRVWNTTSWSATTNLTFAGNVTSLDVSASGARLVAGSEGSSIRVWDTSNWSQVNTLTTAAAVYSVAFDPSGTQVVAGGGETTVRVWNVTTGVNPTNLTGATQNVRAVDWSPDGNQVAAGGLDDRVRIYWTSNWTTQATLTSHTNDVRAVAFAPDSTRLLSAGFDARIYAWSPYGALLQQYTTLPTYTTRILSAAWSTDSRRIAAGWFDSRYPLYNVNACSSCSTLQTAKAIAIGNLDNTPGNDIVILDVYKDQWNPSSALFRLPFSSGSPGSWVGTTSGNNDFSDGIRLALGDLTGDGHDDIVVASDTASSAVLTLVAWDPSTNTWNQTIQTLPIGGSATDILVADVTDDGHNDVVISCGGSTNDVEVAYYEDFARTSGLIKIANLSKFAAPAAAGSAAGISVGKFNNDTLNDTASANGAAQTAWIYQQRDVLDGYYISAPLTDTQLPGFPIVSAFLWWDDFNRVANLTNYTASVSINGGFTWTPLVQYQIINFSGSNQTSLQYRFDFHSEHAAVTAWVTSVVIEYLLETTAQNPLVDVGRDFQNEWNVSGPFLGLQHVDFDANKINVFVQENLLLADANGTVFMPIRVRWDKPGTVRLSNLSISYNLPAAPPSLLLPLGGSFADATPTFVVNSADSDLDFLRYNIQISGEPSFTSVLYDFDQNLSTNGWSRAFYQAGNDANFTLPDANRLNNGQRYYWRARAFDGLQWSLWSAGANFTVDDLAPEGFARSPPFSTDTTFLVTWTGAIDPAGGSGLAAAPFDLQYKDGLTGAWQDWYTGVAITSSQFTGENGHIYCFRLRAVDAAGNRQIYITSATGDTCTEIDSDRPTASIFDLAPYQQSKVFTVRWTGDDGTGGSGVDSYDVQVMAEGGLWTNWLPLFSGTSAPYSAAADQLYSFRVAARDRAGNVGDWSAQVSTRVDTSPPTGTVSVPSSTTTSLNSLSVSYAFSDPQTGVVAYEYAVGTGAGLADILLPVRTTALVTVITELELANGGQYFVSVRALNAAGAWSPWVSSTVVRILIPGPASTITYVDGVWTALNIPIGLGATDSLGYDLVAGELRFRRATFRYNALGTWEDWFTLPVEANATSYTFENLVRGYAYQFQYRARNTVGSWGAFAEGGTLFVNQLPVAAGGPDRTAQLGEEIKLDATDSVDYDGARDALSYHWLLDDGTNLSGVSAIAKFSVPGTHRIVLFVDDGHEQATATINVYVPPPPPSQVAPGFEGILVIAAALGAAVLVSMRRRRPAP